MVFIQEMYFIAVKQQCDWVAHQMVQTVVAIANANAQKYHRVFLRNPC